MSSRFTVKRKEWSSPDTESEINFDDPKDGQFYVGKGGEVRRHYKGAPDPLVIAPKGFPTTQKNKVADTRDKRGELNRLKFLIRMRDLKRDILNLQVEYTDDDIAHLPEAPCAKSQKELRETYDAFHKTFGPLNDFELRDTGHVKDHGEPTIYKFYTNLRKFRRDPDAYIVAALEE